MAIFRKKSGQKLAVYAYDPTTAAGSDPSVTGDAANITAQVSKDGGASAATNDVNPTELDATNHPGIYLFDLSQAETDADMISVNPSSVTANVLLDPVVVYTSPNLVDNSYLIFDAEVASVTDTTNFVLDNPAVDIDVEGALIIIRDASNNLAPILATGQGTYAGSTTKTLTVETAPATAVAAGDRISVLPVGEIGDTMETLLRLAASAAVGTVAVTDNGTTLTLSFKDTDGTTEIANTTYTKATGARTRNS
jgi:hypothetical protein